MTPFKTTDREIGIFIFQFPDANGSTEELMSLDSKNGDSIGEGCVNGTY